MESLVLRPLAQSSNLPPRRATTPPPLLPLALSPRPRPPPRSPSLLRPLSFPRSASAALSNDPASTAAASPQQEANTPLQFHPKWSDFASRVSGEWDGFGAEFSSRGEPVELPEIVVPSAFREWGVQVFDWQTQCPTLADPSTPSLFYKLIRLLPTVGCEADAATRHSVEEKTVKKSSNGGEFAFAYHQSGSYVAVWLDKESSFEIEHCLVHPKNHQVRIRVLQRIYMEKKTVPIVGKIDVFSEQWYGPFRNGEQLGGCAVRESGFASTAAMEESRVLGAWRSSGASATFSDFTKNSIRDLADKSEVKLVRGKEGLVTLPKQLWSSTGKKEDGESWVEAGWMIDQGQAITSRCVFSEDGKLKEIAVGHDSLIQEDA